VIQPTSDYLSDAQRVLIIKMKFLLLAITIAVALAAAGDVTAVAVTGSFVNTTGKVDGAWCSYAVAVTHAATVPADGSKIYNSLWLVNSAAAGTWVVNQTIVFV
jgi:hypothetical protein